MAIRFYEQHVRANLKDKRNLSAFLFNLIKSYKVAIEKIDLIYIFCHDDYLLEINKEFLQHDTLTDIITFDLSETTNHLQGEIYISIDRVKENASQFKTTYKEELHRVIFHGALHLCGYKDKTPKDQQKMRAEEDICLLEYFKQP